MLEKFVEMFPEGTEKTAVKLFSDGVRAGKKVGDGLSDLIDNVVDKFIG